MRYEDVSGGTSDTVGGRRSLGRVGILIHTTMGRDSLSWLQGGSARAGRPASADFLIKRDGTILGITRPGRYAWHSGLASFNGHRDSDGSLSQSFYGIEIEALEQNGEVSTDLQLIACVALCRELMQRHSISIRAIALHKEVAIPAGRKQDPMRWDWWIFTRELISPSREGKAVVFPERMP